MPLTLETINFASQLERVNEFLNSVKTDVTCWGTRTVEVSEKAGSAIVFSLDDLAERVLQAARKRCESDDLTLKERIAGMEIADKMNSLYKLTDTQIGHSNCFKKLLNWIREFFSQFFSYTTCFYVRETLKNDFQAYSREKFAQQFRIPLGNMDAHSAYNGEFGPPHRIIAKEQSIINLLEAV